LTDEPPRRGGPRATDDVAPKRGAESVPPARTPEAPFLPLAPDDDWERELAAWDAAIPIVIGSAASATSRSATGEPIDLLSSLSPSPDVGVVPVEILGLDDLPDVMSGKTMDGALARSAPGIFDRDPAPEAPPSFPSEVLPEMTAAPWSAGVGGNLMGNLREMIALGRSGTPATPPHAYWETLGRILGDERAAAAEDRERAAALEMAAARVADQLGRSSEALSHLKAALASDGSAAAAHRAILGLAERAGSIDDLDAARALTQLCSVDHPDRPYYRSLQAEWLLARASRGPGRGGPEWEVIAAVPTGLGRLLAEAELAWSQPTVAAAILENAGHHAQGGLGAALMSCAAALNEIGGDFQTAAEQRFLATRLDDQRELPSSSWGVLRDLARLEPEAAVPGLQELISRIAPSSLKVSLARWAATAAQRARNPARAWQLVADPASLGPMTAGLARDRLDLCPHARSEIDAGPGAEAATPPDLLPPLLTAAGELWPAPLASVILALRACGLSARAGDVGFAIARAENVANDAGTAPAAAALAAAVEELAGRSSDAVERLRALRLWRRIDPARWLSASLDLADALGTTSSEAPMGEGSDSRDTVLAEIATKDSTSSAFWTLAVRSAGQGRFAEAAAHIDRALARAPWRESALHAPLTELAAELIARSDLAAGAARLTSSRGKAPRSPIQRRTLLRILRRLGDRDLWTEYVDEEIAGATSEQPSERERFRRASLLVEPVFWRADPGEGDDVPSLVSAALDVVPLHPVAFGLALEDQPDPAMLIDRLAAGASGPGGERWTLAAALAAAVSGDAPRGLALARTAGAAAASTVRRLQWAAPSSEERATILRQLTAPDSPGAPAEWLLLAADSLEGGTARDRDRDRLDSLEKAARSESWDEVVAALVDAPPHEETPGASSLILAALIDEGRCRGRRAREIWAFARAALAFAADRDPSTGSAESALWLRTGDSLQVEPAEAGAALERLARASAEAPALSSAPGADPANAHVRDERSAALFLVEAAHLAAKVDDTEAGEVVARCLRSAVAHDPTSALAALAWRRWLWSANRIDEAAEASAAEADALVDPSSRVKALLRSARMLAPPPAMDDPANPIITAPLEQSRQRLDRAATFLRRALDIAPRDQEAFTRLRELYEATERHGDLEWLLAARLKVTSNPFEVTALRLARAEILAGPLDDLARARLELQAILQKEPQHARALGRLSDLEEQDGHDATVAELLIRRAFIERSPEQLRELFLRLGRIYTQRIPDPKRAVGAYVRVLQLDPNNREALDELSGLYLGLGETKSAISITERLVDSEPDPERRSHYHVRLGHLAERANDPRAVAFHLRRAAEEAPRDIEVMGELMRYLERTRDSVGRRAYLDRTASVLRAAVLADPADGPTIEALATVLRWRGRAAAAAAAAELSALVRTWGAIPDAGAKRSSEAWRLDVPGWAAPPVGGRRLAALAKPSVDDQTFPATVPPALRQLFRLLGPSLWEGKVDLSRHGVERADRVSAGRSPWDVFDAVAAELAAGPFELYVVGASAASHHPHRSPLTVEPGKPAVIVLDSSLLRLGGPAVRFVAGRAMRLIASQLDVALAGGAIDLGAWIGGVIRQFLPDYQHGEVPPNLIAARAARVAKLMPRRLRQEVLPFAMESSGALDLEVVRAGIRDGVNRVGLLASGSLVAGLRVVRLVSEPSGAAEIAGPDAGKAVLASLFSSDEAQGLLGFALSDEHDDLVKALE